MSTDTTAPAGFFERVDEHRFKPTHHAQGAWQAEDHHFSPLAGLIAHAIDRHLDQRPGHGLTLGRISYDILGRLALEECEVSVRTLRPGRTIELLEAVVTIAERPVVRARAWLLATANTSAVAAAPEPPLDPPESFPRWPMHELWPGGYISSIDVRRNASAQAGRATAWISARVPLLTGEPVSPTASFLALVDTANGIAVQQEPAEWMFPNLDLTVHLHRRPEGEWTGLDTTATFGPEGQGLTSSVLHDVLGPVGRAEQILTVRPMPSAH
ncbi:thioesterase family protein [Nocardiopsis kunsanensis]|uniref:Thioesterase n=1 Tax=Nocardiopsis kunsanensis TaxID=141693 RepID=A0A918XFY8_9ACTN|nr:thioesterase family protein [Nocardiopsis kunsanensis]GHD29064.1 thioesterase [Nocardiopsis kunsanensis]